VLNNIHEAQQKQKKQYDLKHCGRERDLAKGKLILLKNNKTAHRMGGKLVTSG